MESGTHPALLLPRPCSGSGAGARRGLGGPFLLFPSSPCGPHPEGKKFMRVAIRRGLSGGHVISLWFYYLKTVRRPDWGIFQGV